MSLALDMAMKIGSVRSVKTRMAQDRMVALDKRIQKKRASLEVLERGSTVASLAPAMHGTGEGGGIERKDSSTGRMQNRTGQKQERSNDIRVRTRTGRKQDRTGRKQDRQYRDQTGRQQDRKGRVEAGRKRLNRREKKRRTLNVQHHWACLLLQGGRPVEVRTWFVNVS